MIANIIIASPKKGFLNVEMAEGKSPIATLVDSAEANAWHKESTEKVEAELKNPDMGFMAPEHPRRGHLDSLKLLLEKLGGHKPVEIWEVHRELYRDNPHMNDTAFGVACQQLLEPEQ